jgi:hypothetical protein
MGERQAQQPAHAGTPLKHDETPFAWPVFWSPWLGKIM